jgi:chromosome segregation ATPase
MTNNRHDKFQRMRNFQLKRLEFVKQQLTAQQQFRAQLNCRQAELLNQLQQLHQPIGQSSNVLHIHQQTELALIELQRKINNIKTEIATADEKLDHLLHTYREQDQQLKSWEKLLEQEATKIASSLRLIDANQADDRYLATHFVGDQT